MCSHMHLHVQPVLLHLHESQTDDKEWGGVYVKEEKKITVRWKEQNIRAKEGKKEGGTEML